MALEESFLTLIINHARIEQLSTYALDHRQPGRQVQALKDIEALIQEDEAALEEARKAHLAPALTGILAKATDEAVLDATSALISVLTGATVHSERVLTVSYPEVGQVEVHECSLGEGVGARLWGISHAFNKRLIENRHLIQGTSVLELGSGVGSTGVVASRLGPATVTVTDLTEPLLRNLLRTVRANCDCPSAGSCPRQPGDPPAQASLEEDSHIAEQLRDLEFSDAESVSDEADLFAAASDSGSDGTRGRRDEAAGAAAADAAIGMAEEWEVGVVRVRVMDWKREWDLWIAETGGAAHDVRRREDDTTSALDALAAGPHPGGVAGTRKDRGGSGASATARKSSDAARGSPRGCGGAGRPPPEPQRDMFDVPGDAEGLPPAVPEEERFGVVLGCEVLYEVPHAAWVSATIARRLRPAGTAWVVGAVRDLAVFDAFDAELSLCGLAFTREPIIPEKGCGGLGSKEDIYEDGYRFYSIKHKA